MEYLKFDYLVWNPSMGGWMDGYNREKGVIMDEFRGQIPFGEMLAITDRYAARIKVKSTFCQFSPDIIVITSPISPDSWYSEMTGRDNNGQLIRRCEAILNADDIVGSNKYQRKDGIVKWLREKYEKFLEDEMEELGRQCKGMDLNDPIMEDTVDEVRAMAVDLNWK